LIGRHPLRDRPENPQPARGLANLSGRARRRM
jgi:hypothetical protein